MLRRAVPWILVMALSVPAVAVRAAAETRVPVVIAVDSSRSLRAGDLAALRRAVGQILDRLPADTEVGLLTFDDTPHWLAGLGTSQAEIAQAVGQMSLEGRITVLNDAVFSAASELSDGGVVVVLTDGRDEGSAVTVEDVARRCTQNNVKVLTAAVGRHVNERALRRLALLTDGGWAGPLAAQEPGAMADLIAGAAAAVEAQKPVITPVSQPTPAPIQAAPSTGREAAGSQPGPALAGGLPWWVPWTALGVALIALVAVLVAWRRGRRPAGRVCETCGGELEPWDESCPHCEMAGLDSAADAQPVAGPAEPDEALLGPEAFAKAPFPEALESTLVLEEAPVLLVKQRGAAAKTYTLPRDKVFAVGRAPNVNSLQLDDPSVSGQHLRIVPKDDAYYVVDLETTNGTTVNDEKIRARRLTAGDVIRAGRVELQFKMSVRRLG